MSQEIYVSVDIEADGPVPGLNSMLSLGSVALLADGTELGAFYANLDTLPEAAGDPDTMAWWAKQPEAWAACHKDVRPPDLVMEAYASWLEGLPGVERTKDGSVCNLVFVGYPACYDWTFTYWYLRRFAGRSPFGFSGLDLKSFAMALLGTDFRKTTKKYMPKAWFPKLPHTHVALDDAREQGHLFLNVLREARERCKRGA